MTVSTRQAATITFTAVAGLVASFVLTIDKLALLRAEADGTAKELGCDLNAFVSCSTVMTSPQGELFGFPNPLVGIVGFTATAVFGVLALAKTELPRPTWAALQGGVVFAATFVTWLQTQSIYQIGKLCPWCILVWVCVIPLTLTVTIVNLQLFAPHHPATRCLSNWATLAGSLWTIVIGAAVWFEFGSNLWA